MTKIFNVCGITLFLILLQNLQPSNAAINFKGEEEIYNFLLRVIPPGTHRKNVEQVLGGSQANNGTIFTWDWIEKDGTIKAISMEFDDNIVSSSLYSENYDVIDHKKATERYEFLQVDLRRLLGSPMEEIPHCAITWVLRELQLYLSKTDFGDGTTSVMLLVKKL
jgi:hypothetical protein